MSDPNQADLRVLDGFNPNEPLLEFLRQQGVTVVHAVPGRANVIAGQTGVFRTSGRTAESDDAALPGRPPRQPRRGAQADLPEQAADDAHGHGRAWCARRSRRRRTTPARSAPPRTTTSGRRATPSWKRWAWRWTARSR